MIEKLKIPLLDMKKIGKIDFSEIKSKALIPDNRILSKPEYLHLIHINRIEEYRDKITLPVPPHRKTVHDCMFLTKGNAIRSKGIDKYKFKENQIFFQPALQISSHESLSEDAEGFFIHFSYEIFDTLSFNYLKKFSFLDVFGNPIVTIPKSEIKNILSIFERIESIYLNLSKSEIDLVAWYLMVLMTEVNRFVLNEKHGIDNHSAFIAQQYKNALTEHIYEKHTVKDYADLLNITPNHLNKCVKSILQKTAQQLLKEMVIVEAKFLLRYSDFSISEVSYNLGNESPSNFIRFFKMNTGLTPKEFINQ
jgi:AraC-like DNA-binding protein